MKILETLTKEIKSKNQIKDLTDQFILSKLSKYFQTNGDIWKKIEKEFEEKKEKIVKSKLFKQIVKDIREEIGIIYGSFLTSDSRKLHKSIDKKPEEILKLHKSTRERINSYEEIYSKIFSWYKPKAIADLACGLNPVSYSLMKTKVDYFAADLNPKDMQFLNKFFKKNKINGIAKTYDITNLDFLKDRDFKKCDLILLFKALDSFEFVSKNISKQILEKIPAKKIVVSFPTKSLVSKKQFDPKKRNWFVNHLEHENYSYQTFEVENEILYLIDKN